VELELRSHRSSKSPLITEMLAAPRFGDFDDFAKGAAEETVAPL
jgi:hypothetical protein